MQSSWDKEERDEIGTATTSGDPGSAGEQVFTEPIDEYGIILLETRIAPDGTKRTRKVNKQGCPVLTQEQLAQMDYNDPYDPDL